MKTCPAPVLTFTGVGVTLTVMLSCSVTAADPDAEGSAALVAETVTLAGDGKIMGAVYRPEDEIVPMVEFPFAIPFTLHDTVWFDVPVTVA